MKIYQCIIDGKQVGNLQVNFNMSKKYLIDYMWYNSPIPRTEVSVWVSNIMNRVLPFNITLGCGITVSVKELTVDK